MWSSAWLLLSLVGQVLDEPMSPAEAATLWQQDEFKTALVQSEKFHRWNCALGFDPRLSGPRNDQLTTRRSVEAVEAWIDSELSRIGLPSEKRFREVRPAAEAFEDYHLDGVSAFIAWRAYAELVRLNERPMTAYRHARFRVLWLRDRQPAVLVRLESKDMMTGRVVGKMPSLAGFLPSPVRLCWLSDERTKALGGIAEACRKAGNKRGMRTESDVLILQTKTAGHVVSKVVRSGTEEESCAIAVTRLTQAPLETPD